MADFPASIVHLAVELFKHYLEAAVGKGGISVMADTLGDIAGEEATRKIKAALEQGKSTQQLLEAFEDADHQFAQSIGDDDLKQAILSQPLAALPHLARLAEKLPSTLDDQGLLDALRLQFTEDWGTRLSGVQLARAASVYRDCLDRALAIKCDQILPTLLRKVDRIEKNTAAL